MASFYEDLAGEAGSDVESDVSDVNPADMAKMLQGLEDMDDALFKSSKKQNQHKVSPGKSSKKASSVQDLSLKLDKQHVTFGETTVDSPKKKGKSSKKKEEDFDWDDPLGDILSSDESIGKAKPSQQITSKKGRQVMSNKEQFEAKSSMLSDKSQKGKLVKNLFGLEDTVETGVKQNENALSKPISNKKYEEPKSLESYLDKKSPKKQDIVSLNDDLNSSKVWSVSDTAMTKKKPSGRTSVYQKNSDEVEDDDILIGLGLESVKKNTDTLFIGTSNVSKSRSIMDDIITGPEKNIGTNGTKKNKQEISNEGTVSFGNYAPSLPTSRESRRSAVKRESSIGDPLGLFSPPTTPQRNQTNAESGQKSVSNLQSFTPVKDSTETMNEERNDWLGLSASKEEKEQFLSPERKRNIEKKTSKPQPAESGVHHFSPLQTPSSNLPEWLGGSRGHIKQKEKIERMSGHEISADPLPNIQKIPAQPNASAAMESESFPTAQGLTLQMQSQMEREATYALQVQEQQLRTALQLRHHEVQLASVHERQRTLLLHQEQQMQQLLTQQTQRQKQLEQQLQLQQQRITEYMQALMTQPPATILPTTSEIGTIIEKDSVKEKLTKEENGNAGENIEKPELTVKEIKVQLTELQISLHQCELEKKSLESTLENLQIKHKEELHLMEDCYKRQISIVEEAMEKHNARMKAENQRIEEEYKERLAKMQDQQASLTESHAQQLAALQKEHITDMQTLKDQHNALLEHIRHLQQSETDAVKEASQNMTILHTAVEQLGRNTDSLSEMHGWLEKQSSAQAELRELALKTKETEVKAYKENLTRQREAAEEERRKLLSLVEQLELQVAQQRSKAEEERYTLRQETVRLDARMEAFEREKDRVKAEIERERQHVEKARLVLLEEQKAVSIQLKEEKLSIAKERARVQALAQLQRAAATSEEEMLQLKAEAQAALTVAKEATDQIEAQKLVIQERQRHLEKEHHRLQDLEQNLTVRARELEVLTKAALTMRNEGSEALANATQAEEHQKQRVMDLQKQLAEIKEREQRLAEERMSLSQERLKIHRIREQKVCSYCKGSLVRPATSTDQSQMTGLESNKYIDPKKVILKLVAEKERDALLSNSLQSLSAPK